MNAFTKIFSATEDFFVTIPINEIIRSISTERLCSGTSARYVFGNDMRRNRILKLIKVMKRQLQ